mgnify:CR=1 FL=1
MWRWFFAVLFLAAVALNVATVTSIAAFNGVSAIVAAAWDTADLVQSRHASNLAAERAARETAEAEATRLGRALNVAQADLDEARRVADAEVARLRRALEVADADLDAARRSVVTFRGRAIPQNEMIDTVVSGIERRTALGATRNVTATVGEAIPLWGIAVIVGITGLELRDACENMRDLEDMRRALSMLPATGEDGDSDAQEVCGRTVPSGAEIWQRVRDSPSDVWEAIRAYDVELPDIRMPSWALSWIEGVRVRLGYEPSE